VWGNFSHDACLEVLNGELFSHDCAIVGGVADKACLVQRATVRTSCIKVINNEAWLIGQIIAQCLESGFSFGFLHKYDICTIIFNFGDDISQVLRWKFCKGILNLLVYVSLIDHTFFSRTFIYNYKSGSSGAPLRSNQGRGPSILDAQELYFE